LNLSLNSKEYVRPSIRHQFIVYCLLSHVDTLFTRDRHSLLANPSFFFALKQIHSIRTMSTVVFNKELDEFTSENAEDNLERIRMDDSTTTSSQDTF
jgi:hypothetical protein